VRRNFIREGDRTTANGIVIEGIPNNRIEGRPVTFEGAKISCPSCKSIGTIRCVGPRWPYTVENGQQIALEHDLCICGCRTPPKLVAGQILDFMEFDSEQLAGMGFGSNGKPLEVVAALTAPVLGGADSGLCLDCLLKAAAAGSSTVIRS
jgi:uncharacterized Zn-binding protein involved in type VI secretion